MMRSPFFTWFIVALLILPLVHPAEAQEDVSVLPEEPLQTLNAEWRISDIVWESYDEQGDLKLHLYLFGSEACPHCKKAKTFVQEMGKELPWLEIHLRDLTGHPENVSLYQTMASKLGQKSTAVPAFFFCDTIVFGYYSEEISGKSLRQEIFECYTDRLQRQMQRRGFYEAGEGEEKPAEECEELVYVPGMGKINPESVSLPFFTLILAGLDAFNPCAFFVLLFLLSLLIHVQSRRRMFVIGGIFVVFSGLIYFIFMAAWLNIFLVIGKQQVITSVAGSVAVLIALINIKDYFWFRKGVSLSIPEQAKPGLYQRMRNLVYASNWPVIVLGTVALAVAANTYELLCTAGFPMIFTRVLTLKHFPMWVYYSYLLAYNVIYVIPLFLIVLGFTLTLGARKLREEEGRILKLLSGLMMLSLGAVLLFAPASLDNMLTAVTILLASITMTFLIVAAGKLRNL